METDTTPEGIIRRLQCLEKANDLWLKRFENTGTIERLKELEAWRANVNVTGNLPTNAHIAALEKELEQWKSEADTALKLKKQIDVLFKERNEITADLDQAQAPIHSSGLRPLFPSERVRALIDRLKSLEQSLATDARTIAELRKANKALVFEINGMRPTDAFMNSMEARECRDELEAMTQERDTLKRQNADLDARTTAKIGELEELNKMLMNANIAFDKALAEHRGLARWIPLSERKPTEEDGVKLGTGKCVIFMDATDEHRAWFSLWNNPGELADIVTHWCRLPALPTS